MSEHRLPPMAAAFFLRARVLTRSHIQRKGMTFIVSSEILGSVVTVVVDRPAGSCHPQYPNTIYPINYGYIRGVFAPDGEEQDVYILGTDQPLREFTGRIIAVIHRKNDNEDKWVAAPEGVVIYEPDIRRGVAFMEQHFDSRFTCLYEKSCGAVTFTVADGEPRYILVENESGHIGFPKGHVEYGESEEQTALREIFEETGLQVQLLPGFQESYDYIAENGISNKRAVYFLAYSASSAYKRLESELSRSWLIPFEQAMELLNFPQDRVILQAAHEALNQNENKKRGIFE